MSAFVALETQWRVVGGMSRPVYYGIDYAAVPALLSMQGVSRTERSDIFAGIRIMEAAALPELNRSDED